MICILHKFLLNFVKISFERKGTKNSDLFFKDFRHQIL
jgi:hypothetical protein